MRYREPGDADVTPVSGEPTMCVSSCGADVMAIAAFDGAFQVIHTGKKWFSEASRYCIPSDLSKESVQSFDELGKIRP